MSTGGRPRVVLDQNPSPHIDKAREERQINHLRTNILAPEKQISPDLKNDEKTKLSI
jgi:hypothetical protein